jgi:stress responsive alpha/beta barrel protein
MFTHIVLWKLKDTANGKSKAENARLIKERSEEIANMVDGLRRIEVGINVIEGDDAADVALYAEFESRAAFAAFYEHPATRSLVGFIREVRIDRRVIDYET